MSIESKMTAYVSQLAGEVPSFVDGFRVLQGEPGSVDPILNEIDATVLAAILTLKTDQSSLRLHVAGRRLYMLSEATGGLYVDPDLLNQPLSMDDVKIHGRVVPVLKTLACDGGKLRVKSEPQQDHAIEAAHSLSVDVLRSLANIQPAYVARENLTAGELFLAQARAHVSSGIVLNQSRISESFGTVEDIASLKTMLKTQVAAFDAKRTTKCPSHREPSLTFWMDALQQGSSVVLATFDDMRLLCAVDNGSFTSLFAQFKKISQSYVTKVKGIGPIKLADVEGKTA
ncbi:MAG: hypothetical protein AB8B71_02180 [Paracoccaceae bacterium]